MEKKSIKLLSPKEFRGEDGIYRFPFQVIDKTPGGTNLGRIEWHIEPLRSVKVKGRYYVDGLLVFASQTRDPRYRGKVFLIDCYAEAISGRVLRQGDSFISHVWRVIFCEVHKGMMLSAYPENHHKALRINVGSSISVDADFVAE